MSFSRLLRKFSQPSLANPGPAGSGNSPRNSSDDPHERPQRRQASEPTPPIPRPWRRKRPSTMGRSNQSPTTSTPLLIPKAQSPTPDVEVPEMSLPMPLVTSPGVVLTNLAMVPPLEMIPAVVPAPDKLTEVWDAVKDDPNIAKTSRGLDFVDDAAATGLDNVTPFLPVVTAAVAAAGQTDLGKTIKEGIDKFSEGMPILMHALDELGSLHPFVGVVVLAFKTVYTLEQKRRGNDKKIVSLFVAMRDMMGALLLLKSMENDKLIAPDGTHIEDRLKSLVDRTADDIKICSNVLLAKVLLSTVWDAKLLDFIKLFGTRRKEFEFELTMHTSQGVDKANAKLDVIGETTKALNEQMDAMKALFQQLISPEQKQLSELVAARGGLKVLKDNDKTLLELERTAEKVSSAPKADVGRARREQPKGTTLSADDLRRDVLEDPTVAVEKNLIVFSRKFEAQKNQIVDELTLVVKRESDRVIQEVKGGPHERILDRSIHDIWKEMGWRGNVKARHFVLALRDHYLEKVASGTGNNLGVGTAGITGSPDPDAWAIKYMDIMRVQPILEAMDDDASGFITIGEMNRFTSSRPIDWSLPHWVAFWAVGYRASIIDYAYKIEDLFAKMEGIRSEVLPLNLQSVVKYFTEVWEPVHTLVAAVLSLQPSQDEPEKFKSCIEAEEARLRNNLRAVDFIIDGTDTLTLITGVGRVEKTVFPVLYLLMKHHYEIMRVMRTKVVDSRELWEGVKSVTHVQEAIGYRVGDLTNNFSQQKLDIEKQFQNFAYGMFRYFNNPKALWSGGYVRNLDPRSIPYDDTNEDQNIKPEDVLKFESSDEPSLDYWVYDGHSIDDVPTYRDVESPLRDILGHWHGYFYESGGARESDGTDSMMTFVIEPAEGEQDFKANAWSVRGRFTITGSWSKGENDIPQIKFKVAFPNAIWVPVFFNGHFDLERNALTGVWGYSSEPESSIGRMEFCRIPPRYLTVYPSIKDLSDNKTRSLWKFAIAAVRNDVRREHCPWSYFAQRRDDRETVVSLSIRYLYFGKPLSGEEVATHYRAAQGLTPADACFYGSMINRKRANTLIHVGVYCDSCGGTMGGARLFCFDCVNKDGETYDSLDLCCAPESRCIEARITHRENLDGPHEPYHRLVKFRTVVLTRELGRTYRLARAAFERVEELCAKIAGASQQPQEEKDKGKDVQDASTPELTTAAVASESVEPEDVPPTADGTKDEPEAEPTTSVTELPSESDKSDGIPTATDGTRDGTDAELTVTKEPSNNDKPDDVPTAADGSKDESETKDKEGNVSQSAIQDQPQNGELPTCGKCNGALSFPFWHCTLCEDNLFICDACDSEGAPELSRSSGKHTKEHHLIRCSPPKKSEEAAPESEQRLISIESRLDGMQTRFDSLGGRIDELTGRIGNIEQLLHKLVGTSSGNGATH